METKAINIKITRGESSTASVEKGFTAYIVGKGISEDLNVRGDIYMYEEKILIPFDKEKRIELNSLQAFILKFETSDGVINVELSDDDLIGDFQTKYYKRNNAYESENVFFTADELIERGTLKYDNPTKKVFCGENNFMIKIYYH